MQEKIIIFDFGSQYTQLIARRVRELNVFCEIWPFSKAFVAGEGIKGVILSGSPFSVRDKNAPEIALGKLIGKVPVLGICFGAQYIADRLGGDVAQSSKREYGRARLKHISSKHPLFRNIKTGSQVWMSHADTISALPDAASLIASSDSIKIAAFEIKNKNGHAVYGIQFHPEVTHSEEGMRLLGNFVHGCCNCNDSWNPDSFVQSTVAGLKKKINHDHVVMGISGGVDSTVAAELLHQAIGNKLHCIFVDNGLLRKNEFREVLQDYKKLGLQVKGINAADEFYGNLKGVYEPESKRKIIGKTFIDVFEREAKRLQKDLGEKQAVRWLGQGTIYPDVIESVSVNGPSVTIKSHHNVGGLPDKLSLRVVEPLRMLFKDEVRRVGHAMNIEGGFLNRHPFPGPGLGIRILGDITKEKVKTLQEADAIFINGLKEDNLYDEVWQAGTILTPLQSVGVMGDERTYENVVALRAVASSDGMTADWCRLPYSFLAKISTRIINQVKGINRVVYDISTKPPATIEWE